MIKKILLWILLGIFACSFSAGWADVPEEPSVVCIKGRELMVAKRLEDGSLDKAKPYIIKGLTWSPATRAPEKGPDPLNPTRKTDYGFFFDWPGRRPQGWEIFNYWMRAEYEKYYLTDIPLMKEMNVNTVRNYNDFGEKAEVYKRILDEFYKNGIMVIMTVAISREDLDSKRYLKVVEMCKEHPAILMWSLGNEWNLDFNLYYGYKNVVAATGPTEKAARAIKKIDQNHPVSSSLGDRFSDEEEANTIAWIVKSCPDVDMWGLNIYRGESFGELFDEWEKVTDKPLYISEFGTDSFITTDYTVVRKFRADNCKGEEDRKLQARYVIGLWDEIKGNLSAYNPKKVCVGGLVHAFNDVLWKVGCYHVFLGGLVDYNSSAEGRSYGTYNTEGYYLKGAAPDDVLNEEYFGVVDAERNPKEIFFELKRYYGELGDAEQITKASNGST